MNSNSVQKISTFLMFTGQAREAMNYYMSIFDNAEIVEAKYYGPNEDGPEGTVMQAILSIHGQQFRFFDSFVKHDFSFTPAISLFVNCDTEAEIDHSFEKLSKDGFVMMPLGAYPFSKKFAWVADKFGVTWQLNLVDSE
ncbi:VOC family protein [Paenibacillus assamensis]|uniref:VOC family protein n=1 Tax=Paenibacillus assamensis TaxID=311244 RepID=UPI0003FF89E7|nr:VOC family protein [Paenibacillus assamensis]